MGAPGFRCRGLVRAAAVVTAAAAATAVLAVPAAAQDGSAGQPGEGSQAWSVQPAGEDGADGRASFAYQGAAGASVSDYVQVSNFSEQELTFRVYSQDAVNTPAGGYTLLPRDESPVDVGAWIGLDERVRVPADGSVVVPFTLTVPDNATPGDHPGGIVASLTSQATDEQGNPVLVDHRVGARVHLRIDGELNPVLEIAQLRTSYTRSSWLPFTGGDLAVTYRVRNTGNARLEGGQELTVRGLFGLGGRDVSLGPLPEILPGESITTAVEVTGVWPLVRLSTEVVLRPVSPQQPAGDPAASPASAHAATWVPPWSELVVVLLVALAGWGVVWQRRRRRQRAATVLAEAVATAREQGRREAGAGQPDDREAAERHGEQDVDGQEADRQEADRQ